MINCQTAIITLHLKPHKERRILEGHRWVFAGEIKEDLKDLEPGVRVALCDSRGRLLGRGYANPHSLITVRLLTRYDEPWDNDLIFRRIKGAFNYRGTFLPHRSTYRLIFSEGDGFPGLVVDRYEEHLIVQSLTAGMDNLLPEVIEVLNHIVNPQSIYLKSRSPYRRLERLSEDCRAVKGSPPDVIPFQDGDVHFSSYPIRGQKTGFYLDQAFNRQLLIPYVKGKRVLDLYAYTGAWGITALVRGAREATMVESSQLAILWGMEDARANGVEQRAIFVEADVEEFLQGEIQRKGQYDIVIVDPPSLIPQRSALKAGRKAYLAVNTQALKVVKPGGILVTCSCSHLLTRDDLLRIMGRASELAHRQLRLLFFGSQPLDHPVLPGQPETEYLKALFLAVE
ncbi:MAG: class I SAM-dependent rRNA methyltransferase [bacterium]